MPSGRIDPDRVCQICGGPLDKSNLIGICSRRPACRKVAKAVHDIKRDRKRGRKHTSTSWRVKRQGAKHDHKANGLLLPPDREGYVDEVAVETAIEGSRSVAMTDKERRAAALVLIRHGAGISVVARHLGMPVSRALIMIDQMGYEVRSDPFAFGAENAKQRLIKRKRKER